MTFITTDYSKIEKSGYNALPTGEYEMVIAKAGENATPSGAETLQLDLVVRNDLTQVPGLAATNGKYSNRHVFMDNWKRKATNQYDTNGFMYILDAVGVPEGTPINSVDEFIKLIEGKAVRVYVKKEVDDYNTTDPNDPEYRNAVAPWNFSATKFKDVNHTGKAQSNANQPQNATPSIQIPEEEFPF